MANNNKTEFLEAKIVALENENQHLKSLYMQQVMFGIKMTEIIAKIRVRNNHYFWDIMVGYGYGYRTFMVGYGYGYITIITIFA